MTKKIKEIRINHNTLGDITVNFELHKSVNDMIGTISGDYDKYCYYYANISENENGTITLNDLMVVKADSVNVGFKNVNGGCKNYIKVFKNTINREMVLYPKSMFSIIYK